MGQPDWRGDAPEVDPWSARPSLAKQILDVEHYVAERAAHAAVRFEREYLLEVLEGHLAKIEGEANHVPVDDDLDKGRQFHRRSVMAEIARLRRCLVAKVEESDEERRAKVRERVRKHRAALLADAG